MIRTVCFSLLLKLHTSTALALSIGAQGSALPFDIEHDPALSPSLDVVMQVVNQSNDTRHVAAWVLVLQLHPLEGSQGSLRFQQAGAPPDSLFGQLPGPQTDLLEPGVELMATDADWQLGTTRAVAPHTARNILQLTLAADPSTQGAFQLVMPQYDAQNLLEGSAWMDDAFELHGFENAEASASPGFVLLGTVRVGAPPQLPGDHNRDGVVDAADYVLWRKTDGSTTQYDAWRAGFGTGTVAALSHHGERPIAVPEPATSLPALLIVLSAVAACRRRRSKP